ncbi:MAG: Lrp/AsnC family transcriptional regulator [Gammaproteobacteria bacterium]|nr:Lrp/AsnC family transcriptional regulator [Gammaproteobacteria bacterium]
MDKKDLEILRIMQRNAGLSMNELAERCALSKTAVWRRVRELEKQRVIRERVSVLDPEALGFGLMIFAFVRTNQHSDSWFSQFQRAVESIPEILEFHRTSGDIDYLLRIVARDMHHYDEIYKRLIRKVDFADISSTFVMETVKSGSALPI